MREQHQFVNPVQPPAIAGQSPWLKVFRQSPQAQCVLLCFAHIGGSSSVFRRWPEFVTARADIYALQLPGREERRDEPVYTSMSAVVGELLPLMLNTHKPVILFGHSFGSVLAFSLASRLTERGASVSGLVVSAKTAPHLNQRKKRSNLTDKQLLADIRNMGGTPESILGDPHMVKQVMRVMRGDFSILESYDESLHLTSLACPLVAIEAEFDHLISGKGIDAWCEYTRGTFIKRVLAGGHFYINDHPPELFDIINRLINGEAF